MRGSQDRIHVTHQGTLPRDAELTELIAAREEGRSGPPDLDRRIQSAVGDCVDRQLALGLDLVNDGEQSKSGFSYYVRCRLAGCEAGSGEPGAGPPPRDTAARDRLQFPGFFAAQRGPFRRRQFVVTGPIRYVGHEIVQADAQNLTAALASRSGDAQGVLMAVAPGTVEHWMHNEHYPDEETFLYALADALHDEYKAITDAGLLVQIDDPDLADGWQVHPELTVAEYRRYAEVRVDALNHALRDVPPEQVILHVCWGSFHTPHVNDLPLSDLLDLM
ncbi:MAG: epoxyalkane--coenzyme M transferase, partial [Candidatus Dormibacteraeota bacterium]|nr:epoxyalkane--coenzyme M transferase [Candidatus Dormibacteraeota bacterium]